MTELYNKEFLEITLRVLESDLDDLESWSVYNEDQYNEEIYKIRKALEEIKEVIL
jgi:hypothetical protein